ncbi:MAG: dihydrodipicolinate synthase family protein, partial [Chloroflexota bacterium]
ESTRATIRTTRRAAELGAHAAIVVNPSYYMAQMTDPVLYDHYVAVADASPIPVLLYNAPPFTGVNLGAALVAKLAQHPNIVGVKDTGGNIVQIADIARQTPPSFALLAGSAGFLLASLAVGAQGGIMALANLAPDECVQIQALFDAGQAAEARALQLRMLPVNAAVTSRWGQAGLKAAMDLRGYIGGDPRRPQRPLGEEQRAELKGILAKAGLL